MRRFAFCGRSGVGWSKSAVRAILCNPRYTGRQVWNRQRRDEVLLDVEVVAAGHMTRMRWNDRADWIWSAEATHEAIITVDDFVRVQEHLATGANRPAARKPRRTPRPYLLRGLIYCGVCGRKMQGNWNHGRAHYRCRLPYEYAGLRDDADRATIYLREDVVVPVLDNWTAQLFDPERIDDTIEQILVAGGSSDEDTARADAARRSVADCDTRLAKYRAALDSGADPTVVGAWIAEVQGERLRALRTLSDGPARDLDAATLRTLIKGLGDIGAALGRADAA